MRRLRWILVLGLSSFAVVISAYLGPSWVVADRLSRPERYQLALTPHDFGLPYEPVEFDSVEDGLLLRGWWMPGRGSDRSVVLVHGRNSNRSGYDPVEGDDGGLLRQAKGLVDHGYNVLAFDLRGHGESAGKRYSLGPHERRDVLGAVGYVQRRNIPLEKTVLLCHSMGAAACLLAAPELPGIAAVVSDSSYARLTDLLEVELPRASGLPAFFNWGILWMGKSIYGIDLTEAAPIRIVSEIEPTVLFIHSESDATVPSEHSLRLWRDSGQTSDMLWLVNGPKHNRVFQSDPDTYIGRITDLFDTATK